MKRILILGGGMGGAIIANFLARKLKTGEADITVVNASSRHAFQPSWLYVPFERGESRAPGHPLKQLLHRRVNFFVGDVVHLDNASNRVELADDQVLHYDFLVIATGCAPEPDEVPGLRLGGHHFHTHDAALGLRAALSKFRGGCIHVGAAGVPCKYPPAQLEFTFLLDDFLRSADLRQQTEIVYSSPLPDVSPVAGISGLVVPLLQQRGIKIETGIAVKEVGGKAFATASGAEFWFDLLVMIPPHRGAAFLCGHPLADAHGWVNTDPVTLQVGGHDHIWAIGDAANLPVPKAGSAAHFQAQVVARRIVAAVRGKRPPESAEYGGHVVCFLETGDARASMLDFDYQRPLTPHAPSHAAHYLKLAINKSYWHLVRTGVI